MSKKQLTVTVDNGIALITLKRPPTNSFSSGLFRELFERFEEMEKDDAVHVIVITGGIRNCFSSGADLDELFGEGIVTDLKRGCYHGFLNVQKGFRHIEKCAKPVITAINGVCIGAGLELALSCDLRIASELSFFSLPEANKKIIPGIGGTQRLTRLVGSGRAKEMLMLGKMVRARTALRWGLVNWIVPPDRVVLFALEKARELIAVPPPVLATIKELVLVAQEETLCNGLDRELELFVNLMKQKLLPGNAEKKN